MAAADAPGRGTSAGGGWGLTRGDRDMTWTLRTASAPAPVRLSRRRLHRAAGALATGGAVAGGALSGGTGLAQSSVPDAVRAIMGKARYAAATWNLHVEDVASGEALYSLRADDLAFTGSVRKLFSVGLALEQLGP